MHSTAVLVQHDPAIWPFPGTYVLRVETLAVAGKLNTLHKKDPVTKPSLARPDCDDRLLAMMMLPDQVNETEVASIEIYSITVSDLSGVAQKRIDLWELLRLHMGQHCHIYSVTQSLWYVFLKGAEAFESVSIDNFGHVKHTLVVIRGGEPYDGNDTRDL